MHKKIQPDKEKVLPYIGQFPHCDQRVLHAPVSVSTATSTVCGKLCGLRGASPSPGTSRTARSFLTRPPMLAGTPSTSGMGTSPDPPK
jgi:hypothetical protein